MPKRELVKLQNQTTEIQTWAENVYKARKQKAFWEAVEKENMEKLKAVVNPIFDTRSDCDYGIGEFKIGRVAGRSSSIKAEKLLQRGVAPDVVEFATSVSEYYRYSVGMIEEE